tara:strand:- start:1956 stop:3089 length:1134 start_codon:yes stop_codon:yes gene_type:complete
MKKKIIIIGSGIAGLSIANFLKSSSNYEFIIYERRNSISLDEGYGIQLSVNSISILNKLGFNKVDLKKKYQPSKIDFYSFDENKICDLNLEDFNNYNNKYTTLKRSVLIQFLQEKLFSNKVLFGKNLIDIKQINSKIRVRFDDETKDEADFLIVSDGVFSATKSVVEKNKINSKFYGSVAVRAKIDYRQIASINNNNISLLMGSNFHIVIYPINQRKDLNLVCIIRQISITNENPQEILKKTVFKQNNNLSKLFKGDLSCWPIYTSNEATKSKFDNIFYIGDAFYTFPPTMAQGASQSIEGAYELFTLIEGKKNNINNDYFKNRKVRIRQIILRSKFNYFFFHLSNPLLVFLRNLFIKIFSKNRFFRKIYLGKIFRK